MDLNPSAPNGEQPRETGRVVELVAGDFLLTVNPVDGSEIVSCPPGRRPIAPRRAPGTLPGPAASVADAPLFERDEIRHRLYGLLSRGRSARVTGADGSGRSALLAAVARDCAGLAPYGVIRLNGHRRSVEDVLQELFTTVHHTAGYRPGPTELTAALREIGAVVVLDDLEFGGSALDELFAATPECAFLLGAGPDVPAPSPAARVEDVALPGLSTAAALALLELAADRSLDDTEVAWATGLCRASEGLPLRITEAGALLRRRAEGAPLPGADGLTAALAAELSPTAREILRLAVALGGELPGPDQLPAVTGATDAAQAFTELLDTGLLTAAGTGHRIAPVLVAELTDAGYGEDSDDRVLVTAQHYTWWLAQPAAGAAGAATEADAVLAAVSATQRAGHAADVTRLARTAAPLLAAALRWGAWERVLRSGQEAARAAGEVAEQAYFHHELGVLMICRGSLDRARVELEASTALRGVLADAGGAVAGRRALTLVEDLSRPAQPPAVDLTPPRGLPAGAPQAADPPAGARDDTVTLPASVAESAAVFDAPPHGADDAADTHVIMGVRGMDADDGGAGRRRGVRRNVALAGAGALLVAVLGTVVAFGLSSGTDEEPETATTDPAVSDPDLPLGEESDDTTARPSDEASETEEETEAPSAGSTDEATDDASPTDGPTQSWTDPGDEETGSSTDGSGSTSDTPGGGGDGGSGDDDAGDGGDTDDDAGGPGDDDGETTTDPGGGSDNGGSTGEETPTTEPGDSDTGTSEGDDGTDDPTGTPTPGTDGGANASTSLTPSESEAPIA
ncbi:ATP-binding protein [Streptomyces sp. RFCAC02]|uniref:ATP-binding protein n=1 Tax=Streptomyces sp. RFCAC02 TaxID=2499143 RepID=UPI001021DCB9|nr:ATP-binding protein [Streptomyces sp. RFCAC02]